MTKWNLKKLVQINKTYLFKLLMHLDKWFLLISILLISMLMVIVYLNESKLSVEQERDILIESLNQEYCNPDTVIIYEKEQTKTVSISYKPNRLTQQDLEILEILIYTESGKSNQFEWDLILETILYRYYMSKEESLLSYVSNNKYVFQGWLNKHQYYQAKAGSWVSKGKKITCKSCKSKVNLISKRIRRRLSKGQARPIKYYHRTMQVDSVFLGGKKRPLNRKHYAYVENLTKKGHLYKLKANNLLHDFYELPKDRIPKGYIEWRNSLN
mgnify:FL=1